MAEIVITIIYVEHDGKTHEVKAEVGQSVMETAVRAGVGSIEGECGGAGACATCHVYVPTEWQAVTGKPSEDEQVMLEFGVDSDERSRLGCQIKLTQEMNGLVVLTPISQH